MPKMKSVTAITAQTAMTRTKQAIGMREMPSRTSNTVCIPMNGKVYHTRYG